MTEVVVAVEEEGLVAVLMAQNIASDICSVGRETEKKRRSILVSAKDWFHTKANIS